MAADGGIAVDEEDFVHRTVAGWHLLFALVVVAAAVITIGNGTPAAPVLGLLAVLAGAYVGLAVPAMHSGNHRRGLVYLVLAYCVVAALAVLDPGSLVLLFGVYPQAFLLLERRGSIIATIALTAAFSVALLVHDGVSAESLQNRGLMAVGNVVFALVIGLFIDGLVRESTRRKELVEELQATRAELAAAEREAGAIAERERLARDIHDTLAQGFTSIVMLAQAGEAAVDQGDAATSARRLREIQAQARDGLAEARALVGAMTPPALEGGGLADALGRLVGLVPHRDGGGGRVHDRGRAGAAGCEQRRRRAAGHPGVAGQCRPARRRHPGRRRAPLRRGRRDRGHRRRRRRLRSGSAAARVRPRRPRGARRGGGRPRVDRIGAGCRHPGEGEGAVIRVLVVDDHPVVRSGLVGLLGGEADLEVVGEAEDGALGVELAEQLRPDVVLMDLRMPVLDGAAATARITAAGTARVLVLTTYDTDGDILRAVEAGATGYLLKDAPRDQLVEAVRAAARGETVLAPPLAAKLMRQVRGGDQLTPRELEVLRLVARGMSNPDIARELFIGEATVKSHLLHAFDKLGVSDRTAAVTTAMRRGLLEAPGR